MPYQDRLEKKLRALDAICAGHGAGAIHIKLQKNISWLLGGRSHIGLFSVEGVASLIVKDGEIYLLADNVEADRLMEEEFAGMRLTPIVHPWYGKESVCGLAEAVTNCPMITDCQVEDELRRLRISLDEEGLKALRYVGAGIGTVIESVCLSLSRGDSEFEIAGELAGRCAKLGIDPNFAVAAADGRILRYRHPLPTEKKLDKYAMLVLVGRYRGVYASVTRFVSFGPVDADLMGKKAAVSSQYASLYLATRPGAQIGEIFASLAGRYAELGYPGEWAKFHQGGPVGYAAREIKACLGTDVTVEAGQAYAWNPSVPGYKVEDTFIVGGERNETVTKTPNLPSIKVYEQGKEVEIADILVR